MKHEKLSQLHVIYPAIDCNQTPPTCHTTIYGIVICGRIRAENTNGMQHNRYVFSLFSHCYLHGSFDLLLHVFFMNRQSTCTQHSQRFISPISSLSLHPRSSLKGQSKLTHTQCNTLDCVTLADLSLSLFTSLHSHEWEWDRYAYASTDASRVPTLVSKPLLDRQKHNSYLAEPGSILFLPSLSHSHSLPLFVLFPDSSNGIAGHRLNE